MVQILSSRSQTIKTSGLLRNYVVFVLVSALVVGGCAQPETQARERPRSGEQAAVEVTPEEVSPQVEPDSPVAGSVTPEISDGELAMRLSLPDVVERVMPSVVGITTERTLQRAGSMGGFPFDDDPFFRQFFGRQAPPQPRERVQQGLGSGVIVDVEGIIITNNHVIDGADKIRVGLSDGRELEAEIKGADPASDIAVLQIKDPPQDLEAITVGDSDALRLGESVIAIGNPFGLTGTVTLGIISAKGRANMGIVDYEDFIQTDAAINPGNSGGALINLRGELVGINTAIMTRSGGYQGVGLAIPSNMAQMVLTSLLETGEVQRGWLGVAIQDLTPQLAEALGLKKGTQGVVISDVMEGSPALAAGLERGDVITHINGQPMRSSASLRNTIGLYSPGTDVEVLALRGVEERKVELRLGSARDGQSQPDLGASSGPVEGLALEPLNQELRRQYRVPPSIKAGLVVTSVAQDSPAEQLELRPGDIILEVNRRPVASVADFAAAFEAGRGQNLYLLYRNGATIFMTR